MRSGRVGVLLLLGAGGCASVSKEGGHDEVDRLVRERTGHQTGWAQGSPEDEQVNRWVGDLLARGLTQGAGIEIALVNNPRLQATYEELGVSQADIGNLQCLGANSSERERPGE